MNVVSEQEEPGGDLTSDIWQGEE